MSRVLSLYLGILLGSVALSGCLADDGESDPDVVEQEDVDDVDLALAEGAYVEGGAVTPLPDALGDETNESTDAEPGTEEQEPEPNPWFAPGDPEVNDDPDAASTPI